MQIEIVERISKAIGSDDYFEIQYAKPDDDVVTRYICNIEYSKERGNEYINAYCLGATERLTFKTERILWIKRVWHRITSEDEVAPETGLYTIACEGDNHILYECHKYTKGERIWTYFEGEFKHSNGCFTVIPLAYHYTAIYDRLLGLCLLNKEEDS